jgi:hypothetical protein
MIASQTFAGIINGLTLLLETVIYIPNDLYECAIAGEDIKAFEQWLDIFVHPKELYQTVEYNVKHHFASLTIEMNKARKDLASQHYFSFGEDLGEMLVIATKVKTESEPWITITYEEI